MSEDKSNQTQQPSGEKPVNASRRKLTSAVLAGPVVLGTLASKQALGGVPYHCTISGQISNTDSVRPDETVKCQDLGRSPGFWKNHWECWGLDGPALGVEGNVPGIFRPFNAIFGGDNTCRMGDILLGCNDCKDQLARAAIASYLNAKHFLNSYPLTTTQVVDLYTHNASGPVGNYASLKEYFESLYGGNNEDWPVGANSQNCQADPQGFTCNTPTPGSTVTDTVTGTLSAGNGRNTSTIGTITLTRAGSTITCTKTSNSYSCAATPGYYTLTVEFTNAGAGNNENAVCIAGIKFTAWPAKQLIAVDSGGALPAIKLIKGGDTCS